MDFDSETFVVGAMQGGGSPNGHGTAGINSQLVDAGYVIPVAASLTRGAESAGKGGYAGRRQEEDVNLVAAFDLRGREGGAQIDGPHDTANIRAASGGSSKSYVAGGWAVRRLIPCECESLQGFKENYTLVPFRGKLAADGPRYKALGNSMAVNCMRWLGRRIELVSTIEAATA